MTDAAEMPFEKAKAFTYQPELTGPAFSSIRFLVRVLCVDSHEELKEVWHQIHARPQRAEHALAVMQDFTRVPYDAATGSIRATLSSRDKIKETLLARQLGDTFRYQYQKALQMALRGE
jgi:Tfp pilus assembly protein PilP